MSLLSVEAVGVSFGAIDILQDIRCEANPGDRIGLVGRNGIGKTTLLRVLAGTVEPTTGKRSLARSIRCSLVEQVAPAADSTTTLRQEALAGISEVLRLESELESVAAALASGDLSASDRYASFLDHLEAAGGFNYEARLAQILTGLGFSEADWDKPVVTLSGGQRSRVALAKALLAEPDLLLMDEPTNHLDLRGLKWLESFLSRWRGAVIVTSHDRYFLDATATRVWLLDNRRLSTYPGNYTQFEKLRAAELDQIQARYDAQQTYIAKEEAFIQRYRAGQRATEAKGRAKRLANIDRVQAPVQARATASLRFAAARSGDIVLSTRHLSVGYGTLEILHAGDLQIPRGARVALIGANGEGKTTLLKTISQELPPIKGTISRGAGVQVAHYYQEAENLDLDSTVIEEIGLSRIGAQEARNLLGRFLFSGDDVGKKVSVLSGGERSRLALAKLVISEANLLLLDEPTNHLDIASREALEAALAAYPGSLIFASHDRRLIARLATQLWVVDGGNLVQFDGSLEEYERSLTVKRMETSAAPSATLDRKAKAAKSARVTVRPRNWEEEIEKLEAALDALGEAINQASERQESARVAELGIQFEVVQADRDRLFDEWTQMAAAIQLEAAPV